MAAELIHVTQTLTSGLKADAVLESADGIVGFRVTWIAWDSGFRRSGLAIGDVIVAVNGESVAPYLLPGKFHGQIGQANESYAWQQRGWSSERDLTLTVLRFAEQHEVTGQLRFERLYRTPQQRSALAPGGPGTISNDGFTSPWSGWYERLVFKLSVILDGSWYRQRLNTRQELKELDEHAERIEYLANNHPGDFADAVLADWNAARDSLNGKRLDAVDLRYRELGAQRLEIAKGAAAQAWTTIKQELAAQMIGTFPAPPPHAASKLAGRIVELPALSPRQFVSDLGVGFAVAAGSGEGCYLIQISDAPRFGHFYATMERFKAQVHPKLSERYQFLAAIRGDVRMITYNRRPVTGLLVDIVAALAGDSGELCVDMRTANDTGGYAFAGEAQVDSIDPVQLPDDAPPEAVVEAMVRAIKLADDDRWRSLFADWRVAIYESGRALFDASYSTPSHLFQSTWETSRKAIMGDVLDARVDRVSPIRRITHADPTTGVPDVDQAVVWLDHFGSFDGEIRAYNHFTLRRRWSLQRVNGGPWRIAELQSL